MNDTRPGIRRADVRDAAPLSDLAKRTLRMTFAPHNTDVLVWDGASLSGPRDVLDAAWLAVRPTARAWIDTERPGGKLILIAPPPADTGAKATRTELENLARTLSIEWERFGRRYISSNSGFTAASGGARSSSAAR